MGIKPSGYGFFRNLNRECGHDRCGASDLQAVTRPHDVSR
jgi:hypothetical protein